ncbi:extracellular solute-binding protein [Streptomyces sp. ACA25]|uniref:ABC transporter substrate-binding protein n=1 Tax=Streptomyces sp. ACA25 TaxID=3022596 RepID=UPI0023074237|nr:extracellular solute-binding protein [Streptomyces sp. ACA25]MDB1086810.1 extracellular solute-binding protein [Streptomyces sp. ACA25]
MSIRAHGRAWKTAVAGATVLSLTLAGCSSGPGDSGSTVSVLAADYGERTAIPISEYWDDLTARFTEENPGIEVEVELVPWEELDVTLAQRYEAGNPPDIAQAGSYAEYVAEDALHPAGDMLSMPVISDFVPTLASAGEVVYKQYGMPFISSTPQLFYNDALFEQAGIDGPPDSWDELQTAAQALSDAGVATPYALQFGADSIHEEAMAWILGAGGSYTNITDAYVLDRPENIEAITWLKDNLVGADLVGPDPALGRGAAYRGFLTGEVGMLLAHPSLLGAIAAAGTPAKHAPFPSLEGGPAAPTGHSDWLLGFRGSGNAKQMGTFLDFLYRKENVASGTGDYGSIPSTVSGGESLLETEDYRALWPFIEQMPIARLQPMSRHSWLEVRSEIRTQLAAAVAPDGDPEAVLRALQARADTLQSEQ